jgi:hypothetical protein
MFKTPEISDLYIQKGNSFQAHKLYEWRKLTKGTTINSGPLLRGGKTFSDFVEHKVECFISLYNRLELTIHKMI